MEARDRDDAPDWSLLPGSPAAFLGLDGDFDRRDLKRAYTRLVRRYKPERHPEEFQRIRAAYEALDEQLCYGAQGGLAAFEPPVMSAPRENAEGASAPPRPSAAALVRELGARAARERLRAEAGDDARTWCALALIDDVLEEPSLAFARTLLQGLRRCGSGPEFTALLRIAARDDRLSTSDAAELLVEAADATRPAAGQQRLAPAAFWYATDALWLRLAERARFDGLAKLLARCRARVGDEGGVGELVLLLRLRRRLSLRASGEWLQGVDRELDGYARELPSWANEELDLVRWLGRYRAVREDFVEAHPFCEVLDSALEAIVAQDELHADRECLAALVECVERREELFQATDALARGGGGGGDLALELLHWYSTGFFERRGVRTQERGGDQRRVEEFSRRLDKRADRTPSGFLINTWYASNVIAPVLLGAGLAAFTEPYIGLFWLLLAAAFSVGAWFLLQRTGVLRFFIRPVARRQHRRVWRPMAADFLRDARTPFGVFVAALRGPGSETGWLEDSALAEDRGLELYSLAVRVVD